MRLWRKAAMLLRRLDLALGQALCRRFGHPEAQIGIPIVHLSPPPWMPPVEWRCRFCGGRLER